MKRLVYIAALLLTQPPALAGDPASTAEADAAKIQGTWRVASAWHDGSKTTERVGSTVSFADKKIVIKGGEERLEGDYALDPAKKPKQLDISDKPSGISKILAVYQFLDSDTLMVSGAQPGQPRATECQPKPGDAKESLLLKRVKPKRNDLSAFWEKVARSNRAWLDPHPRHLSYTLVAGSASQEDDRRVTNRVWVSGNRARWEMEAEPKRLNYTLVITPERSQYLRGPESLLNKPTLRRDLRSLRQAITWHTAIHALYETGLPDDCQMSLKNEADGARVAVIETDLVGIRGEVGFGLYHVFLGKVGMALGRVRLYIRLPEHTPLREELLDRKMTVVYDPNFIDLGGSLAPRKIRLVGKLPDGTPGTLMQGEFQARDGIWLLKEAQLMDGNRVVNKMSVTEVSAVPFADAKFDLPKQD